MLQAHNCLLKSENRFVVNKTKQLLKPLIIMLIVAALLFGQAYYPLEQGKALAAPEETNYTAEELGVEVVLLLPGVFNVTIPYANAEEMLEATEDSSLILEVDGKDSLEFEYADDRDGFFKPAVQGYSEEEIKGATVTLKATEAPVEDEKDEDDPKDEPDVKDEEEDVKDEPDIKDENDTEDANDVKEEEDLTSTHEIGTDADPAEGGQVEGDGAYEQGEEVTVKATAREGYEFKNWTENETVVSSEDQYTFEATGERNLVANFSAAETTEPDFALSVQASVPAEDLDVEVVLLLPGVYNIIIPFDNAEEMLGANKESTLIMTIAGKDPIELVYEEDRDGFFMPAAQGYSEDEIRGAEVSLDSADPTDPDPTDPDPTDPDPTDPVDPTHGDINGDGVIDVRDVVLVMKHILEVETLSASQQELADVNDDGTVDLKDAVLIMQKALGLIEEFPVSQ